MVDCDVHNGLDGPDDLKAYLDPRWHGPYDRLAGRVPGGMMIGARPSTGIFREDARPASGGQPGSDLPLMREQLLDKYGVTHAILSPLELLRWPARGELSAALIHALNDWMQDEWLEQDDRLYGTICVPLEDPALAAEEIRARADQGRFVQVGLLAGTRELLGHPMYWPVYQAAADQGLPLAIHVAGFSGQTSSAGWYSFHIERHVGWPLYYPGHVVSLVASGIFDRHPGLQFILQEAGLSWMPSLMWRLDRTWENGIGDLGAVSRRPSDIIREHFWFTTQPMDEPERPAYLAQMLEQLDMDGRIMFSSDYPHWDFDPPDRVFPPQIGKERRQRFLASNAKALFGFE